MPKRKHFSASQKAQITLEILKEEKTVNQIASEYGVHPNVLYRWKKQAMENLPRLFEDEARGERTRQAEHERQVNELYTEIGRLTTQLNWLKKNLAMLSDYASQSQSPQDILILGSRQLKRGKAR